MVLSSFFQGTYCPLHISSNFYLFFIFSLVVLVPNLADLWIPVADSSIGEAFLVQRVLHNYFVWHLCLHITTDCSSPFTKWAFGMVTLSTIAILVCCIKIAMLISSRKVFAAPPRWVAPATWLRILQTFKTLMETPPRCGTKNFTELQLIGTTLLHLQQSVILFLLYLLCSTLSRNESEWHWLFPKLWCHLLKSKTKYSITYQLL